MHQSSSDQDKSKKPSRGADIKVALIFVLLSMGILWEVSGYPITQSWGGVVNTWYVSAALFPMALGVLLLVLAMILLSTLMAEFSWRGLGKLAFYLPKVDTPLSKSRMLVITLLGSYVYILIPNCDFYLATCLFQLTITTQFYLPHSKMSRLLLWLFGITNAVLVLLCVGFEIADTGHDPITLLYYTDLICFSALAAALYWAWSIHDEQTVSPHMRNIVLVSLLVPLVMVLVFKYFLLVPMPTEGLIISLLDWLYYDLLGA